MTVSRIPVEDGGHAGRVMSLEQLKGLLEVLPASTKLRLEVLEVLSSRDLRISHEAHMTCS